VGQTGGREKRDLLATSDGGHGVNGRNTSLNHFLGILSLKGINWLPLDIEKLFRKYGWSVILWLSRSIENSAKHFNTHWHSQYVTGEFYCGAQVIDT
jgi:hypothetical protein